MRNLRRAAVAGAAALLATTIGCSMDEARRPAATPAGTAAAAADRLPASMAALGDSMTRAFILCADSWGDCPEASWSTGTAAEVDSHAARISRASGRRIAAHNVAVSGARVAGLEAQADRAVSARAEYVTVLIGANDACTSSERAMTPVREFTAAFDRAMTKLVRGLPQSRILVLSIPDLHRLWEVGRNSPAVLAVWQFGVCQSMLADATSTAPAATERRTRVRDRVVAYNAAMAQVCGRHPNCRWDGNAVFDFAFTLDMVSDRDFWHPSRLGQRTIADASWAAGFWPDSGDEQPDQQSEPGETDAGR